MTLLEQKQTLVDTDTCHKCNNTIDIPGVDGYHCPTCGWLDDPTWRVEENRRDAERTNRRRKAKVGGEVSAA